MLFDSLKDIRRRVEAAARRRGRDPSAVELVAVVKKASDEQVRSLLRSGLVSQFGENRVQDAQRRRAALGREAGSARWRFIGHLQTNKARSALESFDAIDTLDSLRLAEALSLRLGPGKLLPVLVQVRLTDRESQAGIRPGDLDDFLDGVRRYPNLVCAGLMGIAPLLEPVEKVRPFFREMRELLARHFPAPASGGAEPILSMGMSRDFELAVEEGATLIRIGSALFATDTDRFTANTPLPTEGGTE